VRDLWLSKKPIHVHLISMKPDEDDAQRSSVAIETRSTSPLKGLTMVRNDDGPFQGTYEFTKRCATASRDGFTINKVLLDEFNNAARDLTEAGDAMEDIEEHT